MEAMNKRIVDANIQLQDENMILKKDIKILEKRIADAIELYENDDYMQLAEDMYKILKGENNE